MIWKEKYRIGVEQIDKQHEELFQRVTSFVEMLRAPLEWSEKVGKVNDTLAFMQDYVVTHFRDEEEYQKQIGYTDLVKHEKIHTDMVAYVGDFAVQYEKTGYNEQLVQQFGGKLLAWLINHVTFEDQRIADYARRKAEADYEQ